MGLPATRRNLQSQQKSVIALQCMANARSCCHVNSRGFSLSRYILFGCHATRQSHGNQHSDVWKIAESRALKTMWVMLSPKVLLAQSMITDVLSPCASRAWDDGRFQIAVDSLLETIGICGGRSDVISRAKDHGLFLLAFRTANLAGALPDICKAIEGRIDLRTVIHLEPVRKQQCGAFLYLYI